MLIDEATSSRGCHRPRMKILLVRLRLIGDVVFTTPLVRALRRTDTPTRNSPTSSNPRRRRSFAAIPIYTISSWRRSHAAGAGSRRRRPRPAAAPRAFDLAIDLHGGPRAAWLTWASGAPTRIGYAIKGRIWMYTNVVAAPRDDAPRHSVVNQWDLLRRSASAQCPTRRAIRSRCARIRRRPRRVEHRLRDARIDAAHPLVVIHVSAGNPFRRWPASRSRHWWSPWRGAIPSRRIILTSGPSDAAAARRDRRARAAALGRWRRRSRISANSTSRNCAHSSGARRCTLGATAGRCISPPRPRHRSSRCSDRRCRTVEAVAGSPVVFGSGRRGRPLVPALPPARVRRRVTSGA